MDIFVTKYAIYILILIPLILVGVGIFLWKLIVNKSIANLKYKDFQIDFTNFKDIKEHGEGNDAEKFRALLLKQLLFTQEFVNRLQPLISSFVSISKKWDENLIKDETDTDIKYPSLKYSSDALKRFRDLLRNTKFDYVINWNCPIYDKVNSGYRDTFIANLGHSDYTLSSSGDKLYIPSLIDDCTKNNPTIDIKEASAFNGYSEIKQSIHECLENLNGLPRSKDEIDDSLEDIGDYPDECVIAKLKSNVDKLEKIALAQYDRETILSSRYNYAMDIGNTMYESLLFWNEKTPRILQSETSAILYIIYQHLSLWLIRNDLPLSQVKLDQYLDAHSNNLVAKINEEVIKEFPRFNLKMWEQALQAIKETDIDVHHYFRKAIKDWIIGVQQVRFGINIFIGNEDFKC